MYTHNYVYIHIYDCISLTHAHPRFLSATLSLLFRTACEGICTNIYEYVNTHIYVHLRIYVYIKHPHVEVSARTACEPKDTYMYMQIHTYSYLAIFSLVYICLCLTQHPRGWSATLLLLCCTAGDLIFIYVCIYTCMYIYMCVHTYMYTVRSSVLQCVAVCCSVLQCVAVCCSVLQCILVCSIHLSQIHLRDPSARGIGGGGREMCF